MTNFNKYDILLISAEDTDFLCLNSPLVCAKNLTVSSAEHRTGAFLLEDNMPKGVYIRTKENSSSCFKKGLIPWSKINSHLMPRGEKSSSWKEGRGTIFRAQYVKEQRHKLGINKKYNYELGISKTKEYKKLQRQKRKALKKGGGELPISRIQLVYEDNIKQYGTLTCYLCINPIPFGKDNLEHKIPLCRGGTNEYRNLGVACQKCNCKKHTKTETEYRKEIELWAVTIGKKQKMLLEEAHMSGVN